jgi:hypothetical protein
MATDPAAPPHSAVDVHGRVIPLTEQKIRRRAEAIARGLEPSTTWAMRRSKGRPSMH